eukprot:UN3109
MLQAWPPTSRPRGSAHADTTMPSSPGDSGPVCDLLRAHLRRWKTPSSSGLAWCWHYDCISIDAAAALTDASGPPTATKAALAISVTWTTSSDALRWFV